MPGMTDLMDYLLSLMRDPDARTRFQQDPQGSIEQAGLREMTGQDVRDVRLLLADRGDVRPSGSPPPPRSDSPVTEIQNTTSSYVAADMATPATDERGATDVGDDDRGDDTGREDMSGDGRDWDGGQGRGEGGYDRGGDRAPDSDDGQQGGDADRPGPWDGEGAADRPGPWGDGWGGIWGGSSAGTAGFAQNPLSISFVDDRDTFIDDRDVTDDRDTFIDDRDVTNVDDRDTTNVDDRDTSVRDSFNSDDDTQVNTAIRDDDDIQLNANSDDDTQVNTAIRDDDTLVNPVDEQVPPESAGAANDAPEPPADEPTNPDEAPPIEPDVEELTDDGGQDTAADEPVATEA